MAGSLHVYMSMQLWTEPFLTGGKANDLEPEWMDPCSDDDLVCFVLGLAHASFMRNGREIWPVLSSVGRAAFRQSANVMSIFSCDLFACLGFYLSHNSKHTCSCVQ